jgi:pyridoxal biosynthesis lyase PdxS
VLIVMSSGEADAVPEALGAAPLHRLPDRRQTEALARVDRDVEVLPFEILERIQVPAGRVARLRVGHAVRGQVLGAFGCHAPQRVTGLHDPDRVPERVKEEVQMPAVRARREDSRQIFRVVGGQADVAGLAGKLDDGCRAHATG